MQSRDYNLNESICAIVGRVRRRCNMVKLIANGASTNGSARVPSVCQKKRWLSSNLKTSKSKMSESWNVDLSQRLSFHLAISKLTAQSTIFKPASFHLNNCTSFPLWRILVSTNFSDINLSIHEIATNRSRYLVERIHNNNKMRIFFIRINGKTRKVYR